MDKEKCGHCGEYGFQDGYSHPQRICRISGCLDADECSNKLKENIKGKGKDYLMCIFQNKEKGIQARDNEAKVRDFEEKEKLRIAKEKMEADEKTKREVDEKTKKDAEELAAKEKKDAEEKTAKELKDAEELKARAVKVGLPETATLAEVEAKEKEATPPEKKEPEKCVTCGQVLPEKPAEPAKPEEKKEEKPAEKPAEKSKEEPPVKPEEKKE
jgi:translation initiation factor 4G